jgi:di/tricarboxylate transporter
MILVLTKILTPQEALSSFSDPIVMMVIGLFVVGNGILRTGLANMISTKLLKLAGASEERLFIVVMTATTLVGAFISNSGTVAIMLPIIVSMTMKSDINARRLLLPIACAASLGGMFTLIGTTPNLIIEKVLSDGGYHDIKFFSFTPIGLIVFIVGTGGFWVFSKIFLSSKQKLDGSEKSTKTLKEIANEYRILQHTHLLEIKGKSDITGKPLKDLNIPNRYGGATITKVFHKRGRYFFNRPIEEAAGPTLKLFDGDRIVVLGLVEDVNRLVNDNGLVTLNATAPEIKDGFAEAILMPNSRLVGLKVQDSGLREKYGVQIMAISRRGAHIYGSLKDEIMQNGDAVLLQGSWENLARIGKDYENIVLVGQPLEEATKTPRSHMAPVAAIIMIGMIVAMATNLVTPVIAVLTAAILMIVSGCLRDIEEAYKSVSWQSVVLIAAMMPISTALQKTGATTYFSTFLNEYLGSFGPFVLLTGVYFTTSILTLFISNTATAVLFAPIAFNAALQAGISPYPFCMAVTVAASMCFMSPFSTPPNVMVMAPGRYTFIDYIKVGGPMQLIVGIVIVFVLPLIFPF